MNLGTLHKKMIYRDLRSALGYYDARRIMRLIEDPGIDSLDGIEKALVEKGVDPRQIGIAVEIAKSSKAPIVEKGVLCKKSL